MKVYVMTEAKPFGVERYVGIAKSRKEAEKKFRTIYPYMRSQHGDTNDGKVRCLVADATCQLLLFIHEEELL